MTPAKTFAAVLFEFRLPGQYSMASAAVFFTFTENGRTCPTATAEKPHQHANTETTARRSTDRLRKIFSWPGFPEHDTSSAGASEMGL
ncbi:MAG: hypothetical protein PHC30_03290 [Lentisphaeria bacterium]|nr:hypothetical protein [Lentisphaeria bacterium]